MNLAPELGTLAVYEHQALRYIAIRLPARAQSGVCQVLIYAHFAILHQVSGTVPPALTRDKTRPFIPLAPYTKLWKRSEYSS